MNNTHAFSILKPDFIIDTLESLGFVCDGRILTLNSYENRVYQLGIENAEPIILKFYRPQRWTQAQILEEHQFCFELAAADWPVVAAWREGEQSLFEREGIYFAVFARRGGRAPELDNPEHLYTLGQALAQLHGIGSAREFVSRPRLDIDSYGHASVDYVLTHMLPTELHEAYASLCRDLLVEIEQRFKLVGEEISWIRCHSDCHAGNILWRDERPHFVDFDDARMAPAIQDVWMLLSGDRVQQLAQLEEIVEGYELFRAFNHRELVLVESLRTLRMLHHCAWLARRWDDPSFPMHFPWFNTERYWGEHILMLREQLALLREPPLVLQQGHH